ncbi:MAG: hypothetical protein E7633_06300 [Ruminococcaceae bacterium]|nr:hypothetical protein [Oscillospiraceae bacterium]
MKKFINKKLYNTDTAKKIAEYDNGDYGCFGYWEETLYLKKTGEYFLCGWGGPMTIYAEALGNNWYSSGSKIVPLTVEETKYWVKNHCDTDTYIALFGEIAE